MDKLLSAAAVTRPPGRVWVFFFHAASAEEGFATEGAKQLFTETSFTYGSDLSLAD